MKLSRVFFSACVCTLFAGVGSAQTTTTTTPETGLGQAWPNAQDVSQNPRYHVYIFQKQGVRYLQVNDLAGNVLAGFAVVGKDIILRLPMGQNSTVSSSATPQVSTASTTSQTVYKDASTTLLAACGDPWSCGGGNVVAVPSTN